MKMARITLRIPGHVYRRMKRYPEIKWSELVGKMIVAYLKEIEDTSSSSEILSLLDESTVGRLKKVSSTKAAAHYRRSARLEWKRKRTLIRTS